MVDSIQGLESLQHMAPESSETVNAGEGTGDVSFADLIKKKLNEVNTSQIDAQQKIEKLLAGDDIAPEKVMTAVRKSELQLQLLMEIRNKLIESFDEIMRIQI